MNDGLPWWAADFLRVSRNGVEDRRRGQVTVVPGEAQALVEGRAFRPTAFAMATPVLDERRWDAFFEVFAGQAVYPAALFAGYLPRSAKSALARAGVRLVPPASRLVLGPEGCSPETVARGLQLIAEHFAADPFRLLLFRGADQQSVIAGIARRWRAGGPAGRPSSSMSFRKSSISRPTRVPTRCFPWSSGRKPSATIRSCEGIWRGSIRRSRSAPPRCPRAPGSKERQPVLARKERRKGADRPVRPAGQFFRERLQTGIAAA